MYSVFLQEQKEHRLKEREMRSILANLLEADSVSQSTMEYFQPGYPEGAWMCIAVRVDQRIPVLSEGGRRFFSHACSRCDKNRTYAGGCLLGYLLQGSSSAGIEWKKIA